MAGREGLAEGVEMTMEDHSQGHVTGRVARPWCCWEERTKRKAPRRPWLCH